MDYQFKKDYLGQPIAKFSMGHEAIGRWLTDELGSNQKALQSLIDIVTQIEQSLIGFREINGSELQLTVSLNGVEVSLIETGVELDDSIDEEDSLYESESFSECGLQDFKQVLLSWFDYIS